ncbi:MAG: hypothetical protein ABI304_01960 [Rudaea sp.]
MASEPMDVPRHMQLKLGDGQLEHVRNSNYVSGVATHVMVGGPTPDGMIHIHFSRDNFVILRETAAISTAEDGKKARMILEIKEDDAKLVREDIAAISMTEQDFARFIGVLTKQASGNKE